MPSDFARRVGSPPSSVTGALRQYLQDLADTINSLPRLSVFSYATPESSLTAQAPALAFNESNTSRLWAKTIGSGNTGWRPLA